VLTRDAVAATTGEAPVAPNRPRPHGQPLWLLLPALVLGLAAVVAACYELGVSGGTRILCGIAGVAVTAWALWQLARRRFGPRAEIGFWLSVGWMGLLAVGAVFASWLPVAEARNPSKTLTEPILRRPQLFSHHPLGTDRQGLDLLGQLFYGARVSLVVGIGAVLIGLVVGLPIGMAAGFNRRKTELVVDFGTNVGLAFPPIILLLAMASVLKPNVGNVTLMLGVISIPVYIRIAKLNTIQYAQREFVVAAVASGARRRRLLFRELLPCVLPPVLTYGVVVVAVAIVAEASLSFLGLSIQRPEPTWGNMIAAGQDTYTKNPHLVLVPGIVLVLTALSLNHISQVLRRRTDVQTAKL
jgi:peptide/nickel transport system permease protein